MQKRIGLIAGAVLIFVLGIATTVAVTAHKESGPNCKDRVAFTQMITIQDGKASPSNIQGKLCDQLMFMNVDNVTRAVAFGPHEDHIPYDGVAEKNLNKDQSFTITLNQTGTYHWHDHLHDEVEGYFTVTK